MKLCFHKWQIHKTGESTLRHQILIKGSVGGIICSILSLSFFISTLSIGVSIKAGLLWLALSIISSILYASAYIYAVDSIGGIDDVWAAQDKTCIKCKKIVFDATDEEKILEFKQGKQDAENLLRKTADDEYAYYMKFRQKS